MPTPSSLAGAAWFVTGLALAALTTAAVAGGAKEGAARSPIRETNWLLRLPEEDRVVYRGVVSLDAAGSGTGSMMYPAPSAAGFLAAVITHGLIMGSVKKEQKEQLQMEADKVLAPYQHTLADYTYKDLFRQGLAKMQTTGTMRVAANSKESTHGWLIQSTPILSMTQDQSAIILDNLVSIYSPKSHSDPAYQNSVRVVSVTRLEADPSTFWLGNQGQNLKDSSASLLAESLDAALSDAANPSGEVTEGYKTVRYFEGRAEKMERGLPLRTVCGRMTLRNLRGWLMSVPVSNTASEQLPERCNTAPAQTTASGQHPQ